MKNTSNNHKFRFFIKSNIVFLLTILLFLGALTDAHSQNIPVFKNRDKVCFIGNSITQDGRYHMLVQSFFATRFPGNKVDFFNCGISGDVADGMLYRLNNDILVHKPNYAFLMVGMNDIQGALYEPSVQVDSTLLAKREEALSNYYIKTEKLAALLYENGIQPIFLTPSIYDQTAKISTPNNFGSNDALGKCAIHIRKLAKKYNAPVVDFYEKMSAYNKSAQQKDSTFTIVGQDRVHPVDVGHFTMAMNIISEIMPVEGVSSIEIDAKNKQVLKAENCTVKLLKNKGIQFEVLQKSLPFPVLNKYEGALGFVSLDAVNNETVTIQHLKKGRYQLIIDSTIVGTFSSEEFQKGIDLSTIKNTPQYLQALEVLNLCESYHKVFGKLRNIALIEYRNLRDYKGPDTFEGKRAYLAIETEKQKGKSWYPYMVKTCNDYFEIKPNEKKLWTELNEIRIEIYESNIPKSQKYQLVRLN